MMPRALPHEPHILSPISEQDYTSSSDASPESLRTALRTLAIDTKPLQDFHSPSPPHRQRTVSHEPLQDPQTPSSTSGDSADDEASSVNSPLSAVLKRRGSLPAAFIPRPILSSPDSPTPFDNRLSRSHGAVEPRPLQLRRRDSDVTVEDDLPTPRPTLTHPPRVFSHQQVEQDLTRRVRAIKPIPSLMGPNALPVSFAGTNLDSTYYAQGAAEAPVMGSRTELHRANKRAAHLADDYASVERKEEALAIRRESDRVMAEVRAEMKARGLTVVEEDVEDIIETLLAGPAEAISPSVPSTPTGSPSRNLLRYPSTPIYTPPRPQSYHSMAGTPYHSPVWAPPLITPVNITPPIQFGITMHPTSFAPSPYHAHYSPPLHPYFTPSPPNFPLAPSPSTPNPYFTPSPPQSYHPPWQASLTQPIYEPTGLQDPFNPIPAVPKPTPAPVYASSHSRQTSNATTRSALSTKSTNNRLSSSTSENKGKGRARPAAATTTTTTSTSQAGKEVKGGGRPRAMSALQDSDWRARLSSSSSVKTSRNVRI